MRTYPTLITGTGLVLTTLSRLTLAQSVPVPSPPLTTAAPAVAFDLQQFPATHGEFERLTLTGRGDIDGFILKDGTEVKTAPDLGLQIAHSLKAGDRVTVYGLKAAALPLVRGVSITDESSHLTISDTNTAPTQPQRDSSPSGPPRPLVGALSETSGQVRMALHGPQGEVNGVLLESGTILRFPPDPDSQFPSVIQPHQAIIAEGIATTNVLGTVVEAQKIGASRDRLVSVGPTGPRLPPPAAPPPPAN